MPRLENKIALVTGAARGIGEAIARAFVVEGAIVWLSDLEPPVALVEDLGHRARAVRLDVRQEHDWRAVVDAIMAKEGRLDVLVNNAGVTGLEDGAGPHDPENASLDDWRKVHETNLDGVFLGCREALRAMRVTGSGTIVNVSSRSGLVGIAGAAAYASSKAAVRNHTKTVALWAAQQGLGVRCNSIHPAAILTPIWEPMLGDGPDRVARMKAIVADTPLKRFGDPQEVAAMAAFLASDEAAYVTGAEFNIDGGLLAGSAATPG